MASVVPPRDVWATATGKEAGRTTIYRYRQSKPHALAPERLPNALTVVWAYDAESRNGMPPPDVNQQHIEFEDTVGQELGESELGCLMLVFTGNGRKEWLFYVRSPDEWLQQLNELLEGHPAYPLEIPNWPDPEWDVWNQFVRGVAAGS